MKDDLLTKLRLMDDKERLDFLHVACEVCIMLTSTGEIRNAMTEANISLLAQSEKVFGPNPNQKTISTDEAKRRIEQSFARQLGYESIEEVDRIVQNNRKKGAK